MTAAPDVSAGHREPELTGQTVVVIGGSAGIGLETARRARAGGADVILTARNPERLEQAAAEVGAVRTAAPPSTSTAASSSSPMDDRLTLRLGGLFRWSTWSP